MIRQNVLKKSVLVVDDDAVVRQSIAKVLEAAGYAVASAADGEEAVVRFVPEQTDLVLLDLNLPHQSGWDVFERLTTAYPLVPVIIITGLRNQYRTAVAAGASALMEKPLDAPALLKTMDELLTESKEARLQRLCGFQQDTRYLRPPGGATAATPYTFAMRARQRRNPSGVRQ